MKLLRRKKNYEYQKQLEECFNVLRIYFHFEAIYTKYLNTFFFFYNAMNLKPSAEVLETNHFIFEQNFLKKKKTLSVKCK